MKVQKPDFSGWATRANLLCSDGLTIRSGAFKKDHKKTVPLVWDHRRDDPAGNRPRSYSARRCWQYPSRPH